MNPELLRQIEELYHAAMERAPGEREAFLKEACGGNAELLRAVSSLVAQDPAGNPMERPVLQIAANLLSVLPPTHWPSGTMVGPYQIVNRLGEGGMGEVFRARDTRLGREVAIKTAHQEFSGKFQGEARAISSLNHPNICTLYDVGLNYLVMELVEGTDLAGPVPVNIAIGYSRQIVAGLEAAHGKGIIHRDLKPANIKVTPEGVVKILDFGLAKATEPPVPNASPNTSPTFSMTGEGIIVGTAAYMSPEQARGEQVDRRADIWAFGVILYELLSGRMLFGGRQNVSDTLAAVLTQEPDFQALPRGTPPQVRRLLEHCLRKDPRQRLRDIGDARILLDEPEAPASVPLRAQLRLRRLISIGGTLVALLLAAGIYWFNASQKPAESLAVLPFVNAGGSPDTEYLSDGITEALINNLSQVPKLTVMSRNSVFRYKGREADAQAAGRSLRVQAVLTGRVVQRGDNLSISTELIEVSNNRIIWGDHYNRRLLDILAMQEEISTEISRELRFKLSGEEQRRLTKRPTQNTEAYQFYLKGRYYWNKRTLDGFQKGIDCFQKAIDVDANYAPAYAGLADTYNMMGDYGQGLMPPKEASAKAKAAAESARRIDDTFGDAHTALAMGAYLYEWDWPTADKEFKRALELDPSSSRAYHWYSHLLMTLDRPQQALDAGRRALELDPLDLPINAHQGWHYLCIRQYNAAIGSLQKTVDLEPGFPTAHRYLGLVYEDTGRFPDAIAEFEKTVRLTGGNTSALALLGHAYAAANQGAQAQGILQQLDAMSKEKYVSSYLVGAVYAALGQRDNAFGYLKRAYEERDSWMAYLKLDRRLDDLRADRRFTDLLQRMNLSR